VLAFLLELTSWARTGHVYLFALFMLMIWLLWAIRISLARHYRPYQANWSTTASVIIPVVDEPLDLFRTVLDRIVAQRPTETVVVINGPRNEDIEALCDELGVRWVWTEVPGKRNAIRTGLEHTSGEVAVLVDSDTVWTGSTLRELLKPFSDPQVGGVTTRQRILDPGRSVLTRWADWLENIRNEYSMPAMSVLGTVGCLPGRTIAFRRSILLGCMDKFLSERFLGVFLEVSDDRTLTNYTLKAGYQTVYQSTALVYTDAPVKLATLLRQQYRWARGSQYNTLRMLPWMLRNAPVLALFYTADIVAPFVLVSAVASWVVALAAGSKAAIYDQLPLPDQPARALAVVLALSLTMTLFSLAVRFGHHFAYRPGDLLYLPAFMVINTAMLMPVRVAGFFRMAHNSGWGTRANAFAGERARNPLVAIPYLLGVCLLAVSVLISV
jgi:hyaluronan synthase